MTKETVIFTANSLLKLHTLYVYRNFVMLVIIKMCKSIFYQLCIEIAD